MSQLSFGDNLVVREALDDMVEKVATREKLIQSARQLAEKSRDERMGGNVRLLEALMSEFLALYKPVIERIRKYGESIQESISESEAHLKSLLGIIEAGKGIGGMPSTLHEIEEDAEEIKESMQLSATVLDRIGKLLQRIGRYDEKSQEAGSASPEADSSYPAFEKIPSRKSSRRQKPYAATALT